MGYFDTEEHIEQYLELADGYDGKIIIDQLKDYLETGKTVLELGMGPGKDLLMLEESYTVTGSDNARLFLERFLKVHPDADLLELDAVTLASSRRFDCIYSNKVFQHLSYEEMAGSFKRQTELLNSGGLLVHSFWYGTEIEQFDDLMFYQVTEDILTPMIEDLFEVLKMERYTEMEADDSLLLILRSR